MFSYRPRLFREDDPEQLLTLAAHVGFGVLVDEGPTYCPVPYDVSDGGLLFHLARANPACEALDGRVVDLLVVGPHGYVSPTWYAGAGRVPTWNYAVIAIRGAVTELPVAELPALLERQVARYEREWRTDRLPERAMASMVREIRGFAMTVERIEGKLKLSQNREPHDHEAVVSHLDGPLASLTQQALLRRRDR